MPIDLAGISIEFVVLLFSLTVHEMAHAWTANRLGDPTARLQGRISLNPVVHAELFGTVIFPLVAMISQLPLLGWAKPVPVVMSRLRHPRRDFAIVAAAGPLSNLALAVLAAVALQAALPLGVAGDGTGIGAPLVLLLFRAVRLNVLLALFNLLPIPPLDGGNIATSLLPGSMGRAYDAFIRPYGFLALMALVATGALDALIFGPSRVLASFLLSSATS